MASEHAMSVSQTSMAATAIPLEIQQLIYSFLDTKSFYAARKVCRYWRFASLDAVTVSYHLKHLPILPLANAATSTPADLQRLFVESARTLLLGTRIERLHDTPGCFATATTRSLVYSPKWTATSSGHRTVTVKDRTIGLYDTSSQQPRLLLERTLNDLKETVGSGPWLRVAPSSSNSVALSSNGNLLAVAQERTIQIYDLLAESDSFTINQHVANAAGHSICSLDFEQDDHVLRVGLSGRGTVLYLGTPTENPSSGRKAAVEHWKSKAGLRHTFLDSTLLTIPSTSAEDAGEVVHISGVQLLRPFQHGFLFAGQKHGGGESSHYILGHIKTSIPYDAGSSTVEMRNVTLLARLESFLSGWEFTVRGQSDTGLGLWENMPSAHEHHPRFVISDDGSLLGLAERDKKRIRPLPLTQLFVYRLPDEKQLLRTLRESEAERENDMKIRDSSDESILEGTLYRVPRIPLCLSTVQGEVMDLTFKRVSENANCLTATTAETTRNWLLTEF